VRPRRAVGDSKYGTAANIRALEDAGIRAYLALPETQHRDSPYYPLAAFRYDPERDLFWCPQGHPLRRERANPVREFYGYRGDPAVCNACPVRAACTPGTYGRQVHRSFHESYLDRVRAYHATEAYKRAMRKRSVWIEPLFGEAKDWHGLRRFRLRGLPKVNTEGLLVAAGQNLKRWLVATGWGRRHAPCGALTAPAGAHQPAGRRRRGSPAPRHRCHWPLVWATHLPYAPARRSSPGWRLRLHRDGRQAAAGASTRA
jgi:hypothetical protein